MKRWDIFCKVVDNFGDIGVCWRLSKQLQQAHGLHVRLWVDDLRTAQRLIPEIDTGLERQRCHDIEILHWHGQTDFMQAAEVVIEAFACALPSAYLTAMQTQKSLWINLDYLSAESWVASFHAQSSFQAGLTRHFYFPGFTLTTGGLLREQTLLAQHQAFQQDDIAQAQFWQSLNLTKPTGRLISLFAYPHAPVRKLLDAIVSHAQATTCLVPASGLLAELANYFGQDTVIAGETYQRGSLKVIILPFLSQSDYDLLLSACDLNFVRGEDSWVRAIWAGKPFVWQPYFQQEEAHVAKLHAFLTMYYAQFEAKNCVESLHMAWTKGEFDRHAWSIFSTQWTAMRAHAQSTAYRLSVQPDLVTQLVGFSHRLACKHSHHNADLTTKTG